MKISISGLQLIKNYEGCSLDAYQDVKGIWTIGYGWTGNVNGMPLKAGVSISATQAEELLTLAADSAVRAVNNLLKVAVNQPQFDALVSFTYNVGSGALKSSTLLKKLNMEDFEGAADEFLRWNKAGAVVIRGLTRRRQDERNLFLS